jgi:uncharacterized protein with HEPN domain
MWRDDAYVLDMLLAARKALQFAKGIAWEHFSRDEILQNAIMRQIQVIGEAARCVSPDYREDHPQVPWRDIVAMRNRLVHEYFRILPHRVWDVVEKDLPKLTRVLESLVPPETETK